MSRSTAIIASLAALFAALAGSSTLTACFGGSSQSRSYFAIEYPRGEAVQRYAEPRYPFTVRVRRFEALVAYDRQELVYRQTPYEISYDWYRLWAAKPRAMLAAIVRAHIRDANLFSEVVERLSTTLPKYELDCEVLALEELDSTDGARFARLALRCVLIDFETGVQAWTHAFDVKQRVQQRDTHFLVRALSHLMEREVDALVDALDAFLAEATGRPAPPRLQRPASAPPAHTPTSPHAPDAPDDPPGAADLPPDEPGARLKPRP